MARFTEGRSALSAERTPLSVHGEFVHTRVPRPEWQEALNRAVQRTDLLTWLHLRWEPGDPWQPVQRWMIWQMRPKHLVRPEILAELEGPHPRSTGHYCGTGYCLCGLKKNRWMDGAASMIDRAQWELYQETGCYGTRWWTIQGHLGGHRHRLDVIEALVMKLYTGETDTPAPGDLPYAEFDERVLGKVMQLDKVRAWKMVSDYCSRNHDTMDAEEQAEGEAANKALWSWLESQSRKTYESISRNEMAAISDYASRLPKVEGGDKSTDYEALEQDFIQDTAV